MFGKNVTRHQQLDPLGNLWVKEVFLTIQGEGPLAGMPAIFVRLGGCNLRCWFCDTDFEADTQPLTEVDDLVAQIQAVACEDNPRLVVLTGGEPLRQNVIPVVRELTHDLYDVQIETAGTLYVPGLEVYFGNRYPGNWIVCSPKTPTLNRDLVPLIRSYKYIVSASGQESLDGIPMSRTQPLNKGERKAQLVTLARPTVDLDQVFLQPMDEYDPAKNAANVARAQELCMRHGYRLSLQLHKQLGLR